MPDGYYDSERGRRSDRRDDRRDDWRDDRRDDRPPGDDWDDDRRDRRRDDDRYDRRRDDYDRDRDYPPSRHRGPPPRDHRGPPPPYRPGAPKPWIKPMVMMIIAIVLLGIALATAWWHAEINGSQSIAGQTFEAKFSGDFKPTEVDRKVEAKSPLGTFDDESSDEYGDMNLDNIESLFGNVGMLTIVAMILAIVSLVFIIICGLRYLPVNIAVILCLITFLIALIGPIYLAVGLGDAFKKDDFPGEDGKVSETTVFDMMGSINTETDNEYVTYKDESSNIRQVGQGNGDELEVGPFNFISNEEKTRTASDGSKVKLSILSYPAIGWFMALIGMVFCLIAFAQVRRMKRVLGPPMYGGQRGPPPGYDRGPPRDYHGPPRDDRPPRRDDRPPRDEYDDYDRGPRRRQPRDDYYDGYDDYDRPPPRRR